MKHLLFCTLLLTAHICGSLHAQELPPQEIRRIYQDSTNGAVPAQIIATADCGFVVAGALEQQGLLLKLNASGDTLWRKAYLFGEETAFNGVTELPSGDLVAVGRCSSCAPGDTTQKALAIRADVDGNVLQDTTFGRLNYNASATAVITTMEGQAAVAGSFVWGSFLSPSNVFLTVLDEGLSAGLWEEYNELYYDSPRALAQASDGGYILAGSSNASLASAAQAQLFRTDEQGQLRWKTTSAYFSSRFNSVQEAPDGRIVALGWRQVDTVSQRDVYLAVHDPDDGSLLLDTIYGNGGIDEGYSLHLVEGGFLASGAWGTPSQPGWGKRDWVFRLDANFDIVDEYFDDGYLAQHNMVNAVPLSPDGRNFAYFSRIVIFSNRQNLFYKRALQGRHVRLSKAPQHYQLLPRNLATNKGTAIYEGNLETPGVYDEMHLKVFRNDVLIQTLTDPTPDAFSFEVAVPAELANYSFKLVGVKNGQEYPEAEAQDVVAGDAYIIQGQSNALADVPLYDPDNSIPHAYRYHRHPFVRNFGLKIESDSLYVWHKEAEDENYYADNRSGQWGLVLGEKIAEEQGIPVAILNGGIGGISIDQMLPDPLEPHSTSHSYGAFFQRVEGSGLQDHIRAILFFQGETNALPGYNETVDSYKNKYLQLRSAWQSDFTFEREYLFQIRPGCWPGNFGIIQEAQRQLVLELPNAAIMSSTGMEHDGCHYHYFNGYERAGEDMYRLLAHDFYGVPLMTNIYPPTVDSAWFSQCSKQEITLRLQHEGDTYSWTPGWETDFQLEGTANAAVVSGQVSGDRIILSLSEAPSATFTGLSFIGHSMGSGAPVKNANGIGLLAFYNFPVAPPEPLIETFSWSICPGEDFVLPDGMVVDEPGMYISEFVSSEGCDSLVVTELAFYDPPSILNLKVQAISCHGRADGAITAYPEGGTAPYSYLWGDGQTTATASNLSPGAYTLTLTDFNGCEVVAATGVSEPPAVDIGVTLVPASCPEAADGSATLLVTGGTPGYRFSWSDGQDADMATGLAAGLYSVTIVDANDCQAAVSVEISASTYEPDLSIEQEGNTLTVAEENADYQWINQDSGDTISGATGPSYTVVESGCFAVIVSEGACRDTSDCVEVLIVGAEEPDVGRQQAIAFPNPNSGQFTLALPWAAEAWLYDAMGQLDYRNHFGRGNHRVSLNRLPPGVYFLHLQSGNKQQVLKLLFY